MSVAERIKQKRLEKGLTQEQLAGMIGESKMAISNYEGGKRMPEFAPILRIARVLDTTCEELGADIDNYGTIKN